MSNKKLSKTALHIMQHATQMFAAYGYEGTIMDALSDQADVNKASIYYHFQDKANLYEQCLVNLLRNVVDEVIGVVDAVDGSENKLRTLISAFAHNANANPDMPAIMMRELATGGLRIPLPAQEQMQRIMLKLKDILDKGMTEQAFNKADVFTTHLMIIGSISLFINSRPLRKIIKTEIFIDPELNEAIEGITNIILNGITK